MLIDTHSHIYEPEFEADRDQAYERCRESGVGLLLIRIDSTSKGLHYWANACCQVPISIIHCAPGSALVNVVGM